MKKWFIICLASHAILLSIVHATIIVDGTPVKIQLQTSVSSEHAFPGQRLPAIVADDVIAHGKTVIREGTHVKLEVAHVKKSGRIGRGGSLGLKTISTKSVDGINVPLAGGRGQNGKANTGSTVALTVMFGGLGLLRKGKNAFLPQGTIIEAYVDQDIEVQSPRLEQNPG